MANEFVAKNGLIIRPIENDTDKITYVSETGAISASSISVSAVEQVLTDVANISADNYVLKTGDTMSGTLHINNYDSANPANELFRPALKIGGDASTQKAWGIECMLGDSSSSSDNDRVEVTPPNATADVKALELQFNAAIAGSQIDDFRGLDIGTQAANQGGVGGPRVQMDECFGVKIYHRGQKIDANNFAALDIFLEYEPGNGLEPQANNAYGLRVTNNLRGGQVPGGNIPNEYGIYVNNPNTGDNTWAIYSEGRIETETDILIGSLTPANSGNALTWDQNGRLVDSGSPIGGGSTSTLIGGEGIQVVEAPTDTWTISVSGDYITSSEVAAISANLQSQITTNANDISQLESEVAAVSGNLQSQISSNDADILQLQTDVAGVSAQSDARDDFLQSQIDALSGAADATTLIGTDGIQVVEGPTDTWTISVSADFITTPEVAAISANLQGQIASNDNDIAQLQSDVAGVSAQSDANDAALQAAVEALSGAVDLQFAYNNGNTITHDGVNDIELLGTGGQGLSVLSSGDVTVQNPAIASLNVISDNGDGDARLGLFEAGGQNSGFRITYDGGLNELQIAGVDGGTPTTHIVIDRNTGDTNIDGDVDVDGEFDALENVYLAHNNFPNSVNVGSGSTVSLTPTGILYPGGTPSTAKLASTMFNATSNANRSGFFSNAVQSDDNGDIYAGIFYGRNETDNTGDAFGIFAQATRAGGGSGDSFAIITRATGGVNNWGGHFQDGILVDSKLQLDTLTPANSGNILTWDANGRLVDSGIAPGGGGSSTLIGGTGIQVVEAPADTWTISVSADYATQSDVDALSGALQPQIDQKWSFGGDTVGANQSIGTVDAFSLVLKTNDTDRISVNSDGSGLIISAPDTANTTYTIDIDAAALAIGNGASANNFSAATALGNNASADGGNSVAIGNDTSAADTGSVAVGTGANAPNANSTSVGGSSNASGVNATAFGASAVASGLQAIAIGVSTNSTNDRTITLGVFSAASEESAIAIGRSANAGHVESVAIGRDATTTADNQLMLGTAIRNLNVFAHGDVQATNDVIVGSLTPANSGDLLSWDGEGRLIELGVSVSDLSGGSSLQEAYETGNTIETNSSNGDFRIFGTENIDLDSTASIAISANQLGFAGVGSVLIQSENIISIGTNSASVKVNLGTGPNADISIGSSTGNLEFLADAEAKRRLIYENGGGSVAPSAGALLVSEDSTGTLNYTAADAYLANIGNTDLALTGARILNMDNNDFQFNSDGGDVLLTLSAADRRMVVGDVVSAANQTSMEINDSNQRFRIYSSEGIPFEVDTSTDEVIINQTYSLPTSSGVVGQQVVVGSGLDLEYADPDIVRADQTTTTTSPETVDEITIATGAVIWDIAQRSGNNIRSGQILANVVNSTVEWSFNGFTADNGNTTDVSWDVDYSGGNLRLRATTATTGWELKAIRKVIEF